MTTDSPSIQLERRARPIRLGLLVDPGSGDSVMRAIEIATAIWGGRYCPLIPVFNAVPIGWLEMHSTQHPPSVRQIAQGYIRLFEPDYLVETVAGLRNGLDFSANRILPTDQILDPAKGVRHGVDASDLYQALYTKEFRFLRRGQRPLVLPKLSESGLGLISAAWFGAYPADGAFSYLESSYLAAFEAQRADVPSATAYEALTGWGGTPLVIGSAELEVSFRGFAGDLDLVVVDPANPADVVDFWNLRAIRRRVLPFPVGWEKTAEAAVRSLIEREIRRDPSNPGIVYGANFTSAQSTPRATLEAVVAPFKSQTVTLSYYPRLWDDWGRRADHVARPEIRAGEIRGEVILRDSYRIFELPVPDIARHIEGSYDDAVPAWATAVTLRSYSPTDIATAFPTDLSDQELRHLLRAPIGLVGLSREGIIVETSVTSARELWEFPTGRDVFERWAKQHGFEYAESGAGRLLRQLVRRLDGLRGASLVRSVALLETLNQLAHREWEEERPATEGEPRPRTKVRSGTIAYNALRGVIRQIHAREDEVLRQVTDRKKQAAPPTAAEREAQKSRNDTRIQNHIDSLVRTDVLRVGFLIQCPHCQQRTWYPLNGVASSLECERCLEHYSFPAGTPPRDAPWYYRPAGPFAVESYAQGAYGVLLALRFLVALGDPDGAAWTTSFELKRGDETPLEVDFGVFLRPDRFGNGETKLLLGECKSGECQFAYKDYRRALYLIRAFPDAALVFCTTRPDLSSAEKKAIRRIARYGRREVIPERPANPVIVLTRTELESTWPAPMCWRGHPRLTPAIEGRANLGDGIEGLADVTQQLHLDMPSMQVERFERHRNQQEAAGARLADGVPVAAVPP